MPHLFTCPKCQTQTRVDDQFSGHRGECVQCRAEITVPHFTAPHFTALPRPGDGRDRGTGRSVVLPGRLVRFVAALLAVSVVTVFIVLAVFRYGGRSIARISEGRTRAGSIANLEKIALALNNYAADHGSYPPPVIRNAAGKALHSWRVLILPYLGEDELSNRYDQRLAWDDPKNLYLQWEVPPVFLHPNSGAGGWSAQSAYYLITGPGTLFPPSGPVTPEQIFDRPSQTILVAEGAPIIASGCWLEPVDLDYTTMTGDLLGGGGMEMGGLSPRGVTFATVDGRGHFVDDTISPSIVQALVTPNGGEPLADDVLD